jgi:non-ribosomal peptide synthetase component F
VKWQYRDFTAWQADLLRGDEGRRIRGYWAAHLRGMAMPRLPRRASAGPYIPTRAGALQHFVVPVDVCERIMTVGRQVRATPFAAMLAVFYILLSKLTDSVDITVASLYANRARPELLRTVGFLSTLLLLRTRIDIDRSFSDTVSATRRTTVDAFLHQGMPSHLLPRGSDGPGALGGLIFQMIPPAKVSPKFSGLEIEWFDHFDDLSGRFDLELVLIPKDTGAIDLFVYYTTETYDSAWVRLLGSQFVRMAAALGQAPDQPLRSIPLPF